jgi:hypothetical protein
MHTMRVSFQGKLLHLDARRWPTLAACHLKTLSIYPGGPQRSPEPTPRIAAAVPCTGYGWSAVLESRPQVEILLPSSQFVYVLSVYFLSELIDTAALLGFRAAVSSEV